MEPIQTPQEKVNKPSSVKNTLILLVIMILAFGNLVLYMNLKLQYEKGRSLSNQISDLENKEAAPSILDKVKEPSPAREYMPYEPPEFPGYLQEWKMVVSEPNNFLFLYPERFYVESNKNVEYSPIILKSGEDAGVIIVQKIKSMERTSYENMQQFLKFTQDISEGKEVEQYGSKWAAYPDLSLDGTAGGYVKETDIETGEVYETFIGLGNKLYSPYVIKIRTQNLKEKELMWIGNNFKFLRSN
jgi:hypothetical protein